MTEPTPSARRSRRLSITVPESVFNRLHLVAHLQGRSASNLGSFLIERALDQDYPGTSRSE